MKQTQTLTAGLTAGLVGTFMFGAVAAAEGVSEGALLGAMCNTCHGMDGAGAKSIPALNDLDADEIVETMMAFQSGEEESTIMNRHATGYTEAQLQAVADYYASMQ